MRLVNAERIQYLLDMPEINAQFLKDIEAETDCSELHESQSHVQTHIGRVRQANEDAYLLLGDHKLWVVADGMGGHERGSAASAVVVDDMRSFVSLDTIAENVKDIEARLLLANSRCRTMYEKEIVGSTVALLHIYHSMAIFIWAGDSRIYRFRQGVMELMTEDHNLAQERCRRGELTQDEAQSLPSANVLTRAVGIHQNLRVEMRCATVEKGDRYLLCSDGLYRDLTFAEIDSLLAGGDSKVVLELLVEKALERGGRDNISGIVVQIDK